MQVSAKAEASIHWNVNLIFAVRLSYSFGIAYLKHKRDMLEQIVGVDLLKTELTWL